jgi:ABC-type tungstate transport system permease subunit
MRPDTTYQVEFVSPSGTIPFTSKSEVLRADTYHDNSAPHKVSAATAETYGNPEALTTIRIGNGGLGPTGLLRSLCDAYLEEAGLGDHIKFEWVCNHSRHTQVALQAGVVDIGFTYEREEEARATSEGWAQTAGVFCHDHFVLAGPKADPADLASHHGVICSFNAIAKPSCGISSASAMLTRPQPSGTSVSPAPPFKHSCGPTATRLTSSRIGRHFSPPRTRE